MSNNDFENLSVEILYMVFDYLSAHHILQAFSNMNSRFDGMLSTYQGYQFDFRSISRAQFDLICTYIKPNQVISLILSDFDDTPDQLKLFSSRFQIVDFKRIRMLKLINIESIPYEDICRYSRRLNKHNQISIESYNEDPLSHDILLAFATQIKMGKIKKLLLCSQAVHRVLNLPLCLPLLRCLIVSQSSIDDLKSICVLAIGLISLKVENLILNANEEFLLSAQGLRRLILYCNGKY
jgi:hypothetical protein